MSDIKAGDLVMVVRPTVCCGGTKGLGRIFVVGVICDMLTHCLHCGQISGSVCAIISDSLATDIPRLKKIDPPAEVDSLPTRREIEVTA